MIFLTDGKRHLVCLPYSKDNLHAMAEQLGIKKHFYHAGKKNSHPHYDIPANKKERMRIESRCVKISKESLLGIIKGNITRYEELFSG